MLRLAFAFYVTSVVLFVFNVFLPYSAFQMLGEYGGGMKIVIFGRVGVVGGP